MIDCPCGDGSAWFHLRLIYPVPRVSRRDIEQVEVGQAGAEGTDFDVLVFENRRKRRRYSHPRAERVSAVGESSTDVILIWFRFVGRRRVHRTFPTWSMMVTSYSSVSAQSCCISLSLELRAGAIVGFCICAFGMSVPVKTKFGTQDNNQDLTR